VANQLPVNTPAFYPSLYPLVNIAYGLSLNSKINSYNAFIGIYL